MLVEFEFEFELFAYLTVLKLLLFTLYMELERFMYLCSLLSKYTQILFLPTYN